MEKLIALVDGSVYSGSVCDHAGWVAAGTGAVVEVMHVIGRRQTPGAPANLSGSIALGARTALLQELAAHDEEAAKLAQRRGRAILEDAKARIEAAGARAVQTRLRIGDIVDEVVAAEAEGDMVLIGKRGEAADFAKLHLGSNLERIARSCQRPVFVASRAFRPVKRFLIAFDGGTSSLKAVDFVARCALFSDIECRLLTVGPDTAEARRMLDDAVAILRAAGHAVEADVMPGRADDVISAAVEAEGIDLLVMGAYGHAKIRNLIIGSTTTAMITSCKVPIVLLR